MDLLLRGHRRPGELIFLHDSACPARGEWQQLGLTGLPPNELAP